MSRELRKRNPAGLRVGLGTLTLMGLLISCSRAAEPTPPQTVPLPDLADTEWVLVSMDGRSPIAGTRISLELAADGAGGYSGCNWYGGRYVSVDAILTFGPVTSTGRGCTLPPGVQEQETEFQQTLQGARLFRTREGLLEIADGDGQVILVLERREPLAMDPDDLVGTHWRLRSGGSAAEPVDTTITLNLERGTANGFGGCRDYAATYNARGDRIGFMSITMASTECTLSESALHREGQFTTDLSESTYYRLSGDRLELVTAGGRTIVFSAR